MNADERGAGQPQPKSAADAVMWRHGDAAKQLWPQRVTRKIFARREIFNNFKTSLKGHNIPGQRPGPVCWAFQAHFFMLISVASARLLLADRFGILPREPPGAAPFERGFCGRADTAWRAGGDGADIFQA